MASSLVSSVIDGEIDRNIRVFDRNNDLLPCSVANKKTINDHNIVEFCKRSNFVIKMRFELSLFAQGKQEMPRSTKYTSNCTNGTLQREICEKKRKGMERREREVDFWRAARRKIFNSTIWLIYFIDLLLFGLYSCTASDLQHFIYPGTSFSSEIVSEVPQWKQK